MDKIMDITVNWQPEQALLEKLQSLARKGDRSVEEIITEAVILYVELQQLTTGDTKHDPLIGLFAGPPDLATESETILQEEIQEKSGWTWKEI